MEIPVVWHLVIASYINSKYAYYSISGRSNRSGYSILLLYFIIGVVTGVVVALVSVYVHAKIQGSKAYAERQVAIEVALKEQIMLLETLKRGRQRYESIYNCSM